MIDLLPNETILFQWVIFMVAVFTLHCGIFRPVLRILEERKSRTTGAKATAKSLEEKSQEMLAACERKIEEARLVGVRKKDEIRMTGEKYAEGLLKKTRAELERRMEETRQTIEQQTKEASLLLKQSIREISRDIAAKALEREV